MSLMVLLLILAHRGPVPHVGKPWVDSYLDDMLLMPVVLGGLLLVMRLKTRRRSWIVPVPLAVASLIVYTIYFEVVLPRLSSRAIGDPLDALAYAAGFLFFITVINRPAAAGDQGEN